MCIKLVARGKEKFLNIDLQTGKKKNSAQALTLNFFISLFLGPPFLS